MAYIGIDFDGTLAAWAQGQPVDYADVQNAMLHVGALLGPLVWVRRARAQGHQVVVITGRGPEHEPGMGRWLFEMFGARLPIITRPSTVGLGCREQAHWKAKAIMEYGVDLYVGDNPRIDELAARLAGVPFIDACRLIAGEQPRLPSISEAAA